MKLHKAMLIILESVSDITHAGDPQTPQDHLKTLVKHQDPKVSEVAASNPNLPPTSYKYAFKKHPYQTLNNAGFSLSLLENPNAIKDHGFEQEYTDAVLAHGDAEQKEYVMDEFKHNVAKSPHASAFHLSHLSGDIDDFTRILVAYNKNTDSKALTTLSSDSESHVRSAVGKHKNTPLDILVQLSKDPSSDVRSSILLHNNIPPEVLTDLSRDSSDHVRGLVAVHSNTPFPVIFRLSKDVDQFVRRNAERQLQTFKFKF